MAIRYKCTYSVLVVLVSSRISESNRRQRADIGASAHATPSDRYHISGAFFSKGACRDEIRSKVFGLH